MSRLVSNVSTNLLVYILGALVVFFTTPKLVDHMGNRDYGIWEVLGSIVGYMGLLTSGISPTIARHVAIYNAKKDEKSLNQVLNSALAYLGSVGILAGSILLFWGWLAPSALAPDGDSTTKYGIVMAIVGIQVIVSFPGILVASFLGGLQRYSFCNLVSGVISVAYAYLVLRYITDDNAIVLIAILTVVSSVVKYSIFALYLHHISELKLYCSWRCISKDMSMTLFRFWTKSFVQGASGQAANHADNVLITACLGPAVIVYYSIPRALAWRIQALTSQLTVSFLPFFSDLFARYDALRIRRVYLSSSKMVVAVVLLFCAGVLVLGDEFIQLWIGVDYAQRGHVVLVILVGQMFVLGLIPFGNRLATAFGEHGYFAKLGVLEAATNLTVSLALVSHLGIEGVAVGTLVSATLTTVFRVRKCCDLLAISIWNYFRLCVLPVLPVAAFVLIGLLLVERAFPISSFSQLALYAACSGVVWGGGTYKFTLDDEERGRLLRLLPVGR